jgi:hypothetical protein
MQPRLPQLAAALLLMARKLWQAKVASAYPVTGPQTPNLRQVRPNRHNSGNTKDNMHPADKLHLMRGSYI